MPSQEMTIDEMQSYVWQRLGIGKAVAGRDAVRDLVQIAIEQWPHRQLDMAGNAAECEIVVEVLRRNIKRVHESITPQGQQTYGFIWTILLGLVVNQIIKIILKWWRERVENRNTIDAWQQESRKPR